MWSTLFLALGCFCVAAFDATDRWNSPWHINTYVALSIAVVAYLRSYFAVGESPLLPPRIPPAKRRQ